MIQELINRLLLGNTKLSGIRTILVNTIVLILAVWEFASKDGGIFSMLCESFQILCDISTSQFYVGVLVVISALNNVLRWVTVAPVGLTASPAQMNAGFFRAPTWAQVAISYIAILSLCVIVVVIINAFA